MPDEHAYDIHLDDKFGQLTHIDVAAEAARARFASPMPASAASTPCSMAPE